MPIKVGINGMGRIGRMVVRSIYENHKGKITVSYTHLTLPTILLV